jgi:Ca2+-binding RTX toxin-like protein
MSTVNGSAANDVFSPGQNDKLVTFNGLGGTDTLFVDSNTSKSMYNITLHGTEIWVDSKSSASGVHWVLNSVEKINFQSGGVVDLVALFPAAFPAPDTTPPLVSTFSPADGATGIAINQNIVVTFNESVKLGTGTIVIKDGNGVAIETYDAAAASHPNLSISGAVLTINPTNNLAFNSGYSVEFAAGSIKDLAGNAYAGTTTYNFTTSDTVVVNGTARADVLTTNGINTAAVMNGLAGNDTITGGAGNDTLDGGAGKDSLDGGAGADSMAGGSGNDTYVVDNAGDVVTETAGAGTGTDTVKSSIGYILGANVENLVLTGTAISGTGNELKNVITGNASDNILDGGLGADKLIGGAGNDTYHVDLTAAGKLNDIVTEIAGAGTDTIQLQGASTNAAAVTLKLKPTMENLDASLTGTSLLNLKGNASDNILAGNDAANVLNGATGNDTLNGGSGDDKLIGGVGLDSLSGGNGSDTFVFDTPLNATTNLDTITDFVSGVDHLQLSSKVFTHLKGDHDLTDNFHDTASAVAQDANDYIVYDSSTGALYYDADGSGAGAAVQFAELAGHPALSATDIFSA